MFLQYQFYRRGKSLMRILIIEDEKRLAKTLADILAQNNYITDIAYDGEAGLDNAMSGIYDAIILDIMLPKMTGYQVLSELRDNGIHTPVLMLTAKSELDDRVKGLNLGSDYYLTKPFETAELLACLRAITRRRGEFQSQELVFGDIVLDVSSAEVRCSDRFVRLRAKELEILRLLVENQGRLISKEMLQTKVWGYDSETEGNVVEVYMTFLRKKLAHIRSSVRITAVRSIGYHLEVKSD